MDEAGARAVGVLIDSLTLLALVVGGGWALYRLRSDRREKQSSREDILHLKKEALLVAFNAEVLAIRWLLWSQCSASFRILQEGGLPVPRDLLVPTDVYKSNVEFIGELREITLAGELVGFYAKLGGTNETARLIADGTYSGEENTREYLVQLALCLRSAVNLCVLLKHMTKGLKNPNIYNGLHFEDPDKEQSLLAENLQILAMPGERLMAKLGDA